MTVDSRAIVACNAEDTFYAMMDEGYASKATHAHIVEKMGRPSEKVFHYNHPHNAWWGEDRYVVSDQSAYSYGQTIVGCNSTPIWLMQYWGMYAEEAIPTLKAALSLRYAQRMFTGGRGPSLFRSADNSLLYFNDCNGDFFRFFGREGVCRTMATIGRGERLGWHEYHGGLLL